MSPCSDITIANIQFGGSVRALRRAVAAERELNAHDLNATASVSATLDRVEKLITAGALTDAALLFLDWKLPLWQLRRLVWDDGEWHCALSRHPNLPIEFDSTVEGHDERLELAMLAAIAEAQRLTNGMRDDREGATQADPAACHPVCCDNFS